MNEQTIKVWARWDKNAPKNSIYVGRPSPFGNPFKMNSEEERNEVCDKYEKYVNSNPQLIEKIKRELKGKHLVCYCAPKRCHADTLLRIANE